MTTLEFTLDNWETTSLGKIARISIGVLGVVTATLTLMLAAVIDGGSWVLVLAGLALAATSTRAARNPNVTRLLTVTANLIVIPLLMRLG